MGADRRRLISPLEQTEADRRRLISPLGQTEADRRRLISPLEQTEADRKRLKNPLEQMQPAVRLQQRPRTSRPPVTVMAEIEERMDRPPVTAMAEMDRPPLQRTRSDISWQDFYAVSRSREGRYFTVSSMHMKLKQSI
jgi:hypothetical protein